MKAYQSLPEGYREVMKMDLQNDKKTALTLNLGGAAAMVIVFLAGHFIVPLHRFLQVGGLKFIVLLAAYLGYIVLHELTHAVVMRAVGGGKVQFGFTGMYAYAGSSEDYFDKISYRCIALAPLVVWGILFFVLAFLVPEEWFWVIWFLQAGNIGGAAGDVYVTAKLWNASETILVKDTGVDMTVYDKER